MKAPWFPFFTADWIVGVTSLSAAERGVYVSLLALMYDRNGPLVRDDGRLSRQCGLPKAGFVRALDGLIATGKIIFEEGCLFNLRAKSELTERENRKLTATSSAHSRWQKSKQNQTSSDANAVLEQCGTDATRARVPQPQPQPEKKGEERVGAKAPFETPSEILESVLSAEIAVGVIEHRRKMRKPLTVMAAKGLAREFSETSDPNLAARTMVEQGWQGFRRDWFDRITTQKGQGNGQSGKRTIFDVIDRAQERLNELPDRRGDEMREGTVLSISPTRV